MMSTNRAPWRAALLRRFSLSAFALRPAIHRERLGEERRAREVSDADDDQALGPDVPEVAFAAGLGPTDFDGSRSDADQVLDESFAKPDGGR